jgi:hypothetical protein
MLDVVITEPPGMLTSLENGLPVPPVPEMGLLEPDSGVGVEYPGTVLVIPSSTHVCVGYVAVIVYPPIVQVPVNGPGLRREPFT